MRTSTADVDHSDAPYVIVSSDTHAGLKPEEYRPYLDQRYRAQFDEWVRNRHQHRVLIEEVNGDYVEAWERDNAEGLRGASAPPIRHRYLDLDGGAGEIIFADGDSVTGQESPPFGAGLAAGQITDPGLAFAGARAVEALGVSGARLLLRGLNVVGAALTCWLAAAWWCP